MANDIHEYKENEGLKAEVIYNKEKDFYKGAGGELRMKAEALFKKAKEKKISIEDVSIDILRENKVEFPGIGKIELPSYIVKVRGKDMLSGQIIVDGKQIDYYNRYQKYIAQRIEKKNMFTRVKNNQKEYGEETKNSIEYLLTEWEKFKIGKELLDDKEFGLEKTITGACDRIIRKLMGENDWLYPDEVRLLDEEYNFVQDSINKNNNEQKDTGKKKATQKQINYLRQKLKNYGLNANDDTIFKMILKEAGFENTDEVSISDMSKIIESINSLIPKVKETIEQEPKN
ncbi:UNVERIFIED_CONTAM: hypothetical protein Cloal_2599 [Acetivibrio alkalicellulosi]